MINNYSIIQVQTVIKLNPLLCGLLLSVVAVTNVYGMQEYVVHEHEVPMRTESIGEDRSPSSNQELERQEAFQKLLADKKVNKANLLNKNIKLRSEMSDKKNSLSLSAGNESPSEEHESLEVKQENNKEVKVNKAVEVSPEIASFAQKASATIAANFTRALEAFDSATGLSELCSEYIAQPITDAWFKARKLQNRYDREYYDISESIRKDGELVTLDPETRGLLNKAIDNITSSVMKMYHDGVSVEQVGKFLANSTQLLLTTPLVALGSIPGAAIGAVAGAVRGAAAVPADSYETLSDNGSSPVSGGAAMVALSPAIAVATAIGGVGGGASGAYEGFKVGPDYTSKGLQKVGQAVHGISSNAYGRLQLRQED